MLIIGASEQNSLVYRRQLECYFKRKFAHHSPLSLTSRIAETPSCTLRIASGKKFSKFSTDETTPAHAFPPEAAFPIPEKSGVGEKDMFRSSFEIFDP